MFSFSFIITLMTIIVIAFTLIGVLYSRGRVETIDDFLTARGSTNPLILTATFLASFLGVFVLFTPPEAASIGGITTILGYALGVGSLYLAFSVLSPRVRNYLPEGSTINDYALKRYGKKMYSVIVLLSIFYMLVHIIAELTAISQVAYQIANIPPIYTALLIGLGTMVYTTYGGLKASMFTDLIQMILIVVLLIIISIGIVYYTNGIEEILEKISSNRPELLDFKNISGIEYGLTLCIGVFAANLFHQGYWQRIYSGKDNNAVRKSLILCILIVIPIMLLTGLIGIASAGYGLDSNPSVALFSFLYSLFPKSLIILLFVLALVLVMSTVDTLLNAIVATISSNSRIFFKLKKKNPLTHARIVTTVLILLVIFVSARGYSVLYLFLVADLVCAGVFVPLFYGLFNSSLKENTVIIASILGVLSGIPLFVAEKLLLSFILPIAVSTIICILDKKEN